jgi:hypothetical protein
MQVLEFRSKLDLESRSKLKLRLKVENFMKEYGLLILLLSTIFTAAVGRILTGRILTASCASYHAAATEIQIVIFGPNGFPTLSPV